MIVLDILIIIFLFSLFAISHTWLASKNLKTKLVEKIGTRIAFYRIFYNTTSFLFFITFYTLSPKSDVIIFDLQYPFDIITFALQVLSLIGLIWASRQVDWKEFLGISQIARYMRGDYNIDEMDEKQRLTTSGAFKLVRHPIYLFTILFLGFRPQMNLFYMVTFICIVIYFYAGSIFEERKLVELFGDEYKQYQNKVPRIFPFKLRRR